MIFLILILIFGKKINKKKQMESSLNNKITLGGNTYIMGLEEKNTSQDINEDSELQKKELEELIKNVPYSLSVALIKISQLHDYEPMDIDTLYQKILPAFPLLRRNDGSKYQSHSVHTVRSAMVSNKLYIKDQQGKYVLNVPNAIKIIRAIKTKKKTNNKEKEIKPISYNNKNDINNNTKKDNLIDDKEIFIDYDSQNIDTSNINDNISNKPSIKQIKLKAKNNKEISPKNKIEKYEKTFLVLDNLLNTSESDKLIYSQLDLDLSNLEELSKLPENKLNADKMIGMLCVFKFFKPFLERSLKSVHCQEIIMKKLIDVSNEVQNMENLYKINKE